MRVSRDGRMATPRVVSKKLDAIGPEAAISPAAPKVSAGAGATADGDNRKRTALREGVHPANGIGSDGENHGAGSFDVVVAQLCRVISGCSQLLRLRDVIGEEEEEALNIMSRRGSPVLLTAVETYGANQDLEVYLKRLHSKTTRELGATLIPVTLRLTVLIHKQRWYDDCRLSPRLVYRALRPALLRYRLPLPLLKVDLEHQKTGMMFLLEDSVVFLCTRFVASTAIALGVFSLFFSTPIIFQINRFKVH